MNAKPIVFRQGEENGIVIEREGFEHSIFINQYQQAIYIFQRLWDQRQRFVPQGNVITPLWKYGVDNQFSNIIAFCGDRGEGKSSCMTSFATILTDDNVREKTQLTLKYPKDLKGDNTFPATSELDWLGVIDPSFFDKEHNLLELLLGSMYAKVSENKTNKDRDTDWAFHRRKLMEQFEIVKNSISLLEPKERIYDSIGEMSDLAAGVQLKSEIQKLFKYYLDLLGKKCLLICIDDLDLNIKDGYQMSEMLRKYLINPYCIVLVSVKVEQLIEIIATAHSQEVKDTELKWPYCMNMAQKYVAKLLPRGNQVPMPSAEDICEFKIKIADINEQDDNLGLKDLTVKERVVQLIFQKTGYVFYNGQYLSPIVPTNLRSLRHLLSTLEALPDARTENWEDNETGRTIFKDYFFNTWVKRLTIADYDFAQQLAVYSNLSTLNAFVVEYLAKRVKEEKIEIKVKNSPKSSTSKAYPLFDTNEDEEIVALEDDYAQLYLDITNRTNTSANISLGDVMYVLWLISIITLNKDIQNLIFFIKTVYSMRLYACYNNITVDKGTSLFPINDEKTIKTKLHKADSLYANVNQLQRLVNGSYFSYPRGAFLTNKCDRFEIYITRIKDCLRKIKIDNADEKMLQLCELLALCVTRTANVDNIDDDNYSRTTKTPTFLGTLSNRANYVIFDFLQPFYSLCNVEYAYNRFDEILSNNPDSYNETENKETGVLYNIALNNEKSLLSKMLKVRENQYDDKWFMHGLVSDAIIRIVDVQWAIYDELLRQYTRHRKGSAFKKMWFAYDDIQKIGLTLYPKLQIKDNKVKGPKDIHTIEFEFLNPIKDLLKKLQNYKSFEDATYDNENDKKKEADNIERPIIDKNFVKKSLEKALKDQKAARKGKHIFPNVSKELASHTNVSRQKLTSAFYDAFDREKSYTKNEILNRVDDITKILKRLNK